MEREKIKNDTALLILLFIVIGSLFLYNKHDVFMSAESDGYFHALGAFFVYDFAKWWITSPTLSLDLIRSFVIDYEVHYKFFGGISYYQPFQSLFAGFLAFFSGKQPLTFYIATSLETIGTMLFAYRIYGLLYGNRKRLFRFLVPVLIAFSPAVFNYGASFSLDPAVMLFTTMTIYYFIRYMKTEAKGDMYKTAASAGLGMLTKSTFVIVLPMLLLSLFLERKHKPVLRNLRTLGISLVIFLVVISPWLASEYVYSSLGISKAGERLEAATPSFELMIGTRLANAGITVWVVFGTLLLVPFFLYKFLKSKRITGEITMLVFIVLYSLFYNLMANAVSPVGIQSRYIMASVPFAVVLSVRGIQLLFERKKYTKYRLPVIGIILFISVLSCYNYTTVQKNNLAATDILSPAIYVMDNTQTPTTALSTFSRMQAVAFDVLDSRNVSVVEAPYTASGGIEELKIMLDSRDYVRRLHKPEWEKFNMTHPPIGWVIVHEKYDGGWAEPDYCLKCIIDQRDDFELVQVMEGSWPGNRVFIYKRKPSFFY